MNKNGIVFHTFWYGKGEEDYDGLLFSYYDEEELKLIFANQFNIIEVGKYQEEEENDSIYIICQKG